MFICPTCENELVRQEAGRGVFWTCQRCGGKAATIAVLRKTLAKKTVNELWLRAREANDQAKEPGKRPCPACERPMVTVPAWNAAGAFAVDVCIADYVVWFDPQEYEALPHAIPSGVVERELPMEARLLLAKYEGEHLDLEPEFPHLSSAPPPEGWKAVPAYFGLPVEQESRSLRQLPLATWAISGAVLLLSLVELMTDSRSVAEDFGLVAAQPWYIVSFRLLTYFFLHGGAGHLITNLYFLLVFGDDVEDYIGQNRYLLLLFAASIAGGLTHVLTHPESSAPLVGANAGIAGLLAFYGAQYPRARIGFLIGLPGVLSEWVELRAWMYVPIWIVLQAIGAVREVPGLTRVSLTAQIGGALAGFVFWLFWRKHQQGETTQPA